MRHLNKDEFSCGVKGWHGPPKYLANFHLTYQIVMHTHGILRHLIYAHCIWNIAREDCYDLDCVNNMKKQHALLSLLRILNEQ